MAPDPVAPVQPTTTARRALVADAALAVLAQAGSRGLTHRAVDAQAGLPAGSTSYYHRSRAALLTACVRRLVEMDHAQLDAMTPLVTARSAATLADALAGVLHGWLTVDRWRHLARYELSLESVRRPELAAELHRGGNEIRARIAGVLDGLGATEPERHAAVLVACVDGLLFDGIVGANARTPVDARAVRAAAHDLVRAVQTASGQTASGQTAVGEQDG